MPNSPRSIVAALGLLLVAGTAVMAQPRLIQLSSGGQVRLSHDGQIFATTGAGGIIRYRLQPTFTAETITGGQGGPVGISNDGSVIGGNLVNSGVNGFPVGASIGGRWANGVWTEVAPVDAATVLSGTISTGNDLSADGRFLCGLAYSGVNVGFIYDHQLNVSYTVNHPSGFGRARVNSISGDGRVAGGNSSTDGSNITMYATVWEWDATTQQYVASFLNSTVNASVDAVPDISADGSTAIGVLTDISGTRGRYWKKVGGTWVETLIPAPASPPSNLTDPTWPLTRITPTGVSADGNTIVGIMTYSPGGFQSFAAPFIWTPTLGTRDLRDYAISLGATNLAALGGTFVTVSGDGQTISGAGLGVAPWILQLNATGPAIPPVIVQQPPATVTLSLCSSVALNVAAAGSGPFTFQWQRNGVNISNGTTTWGSSISGATTSALFINNRRPEDVGTYTVVISSPAGSVTSNGAVLSIDSTAPVPSNQSCATAIDMAEGTVNASICNAWNTTGTASCRSGSIASVWYRYTPSFTGSVRIDTCGSNYDTVVSVFSACGGTELACNDNTTGLPACNLNSTSRIRNLNVQLGVPVLIRVASGSSSPSGGQMTLNVFQAPAPPPNDTCAGATDAVVGSNEWSTVEAFNEGATSSCRTGTGPDVWFRYTAPTAGLVTISTCGATTMNTVLTAYAACGGPELACNDNFNVSPCTFQSTLSNIPVQAGVPILFRVTGNTSTLNGSGSFTLDFTSTGPVCVADIVGIGGQPPRDGSLTGDDFIAFINAFGSNNSLADIVGIGGQPPADGLITGDDFNAFIAAFASGCP